MQAGVNFFTQLKTVTSAWRDDGYIEKPHHRILILCMRVSIYVEPRPRLNKVLDKNQTKTASHPCLSTSRVLSTSTQKMPA